MNGEKYYDQETKISQTADAVDIVAGSLGDLKDASGKSSFSDIGASIQATSDSIKNKVWNADIQIGGRNYYKSSTPITGYNGQTFDRSNTECVNGFYAVGVQGAQGILRLSNVITDNGYWTVSFEFRGSQNLPIGFYVNVCDFKPTKVMTTGDNTWSKVSVTVNVTNYTNEMNNFVKFQAIDWAYFYIRNIKVEKGTKATDWSPAPEDIQKNIDSINVGGRNLVPSTDFVKLSSNYIKNGSYTIAIDETNKYNNYNSLKVISGTVGDTVSNRFYIITTQSNQSINEEYTISFYAKSSSGSNKLNIRAGNAADSFTAITDNIPAAWTRFQTTIKLNSVSAGALAMMFWLNNADTVWISQLKIEKGNKATDWTPAPEDVQSQIDTTVTRISNAEQKITSDSIISTVSKSITSATNKSTIIDSNDSSITYVGNWKTESNGNFQGGTATYCGTVSDYAQYTFIGTGIGLYVTKSTNFGIAEIFIDGVSKGTFDLYATSAAYKVKLLEVTGLAYGVHTIKFLVKGTKNTASTNYYIELDYLEVLNTMALNTTNLISTINQTANAVKISASAVDLTGFVTITNLGTAGSVTIDGGNIKGGTLTLGGSINGYEILLDANGKPIASLGKDGIIVKSGSIQTINEYVSTIKDYSSYSKSVLEHDALYVISGNSDTTREGVAKYGNSGIDIDYRAGADAEWGSFYLGKSSVSSELYNGDIEFKNRIGNANLIFKNQDGAMTAKIANSGDFYIAKRIQAGTEIYGNYFSVGSAIGSFSIRGGTGDGASWSTYNAALHCWWGFSMGSDAWGSYVPKFMFDCRNGNFSAMNNIVGNSKSNVTETEEFGTVITFADESPSHIHIDRGLGELDEEGQCIIVFDPKWLATVSTKLCDYWVMLTDFEGSDVKIRQLNPDNFIVVGTPKAKFMWRAEAERKGYEHVRFNEALIDF